ncbi:MAG TPA: hypothetical protein VFB78_10850 [Acidimicrobiales bacterium]|nr:hypothetical protein [Acidimicrobiales bacterium]
MSFDDRLRDGLTDAGRAYDAGPPPVDGLAANVRKRRRVRVALAGGGTAVVAIVVVVALVVAGRDTRPTTDLTLAGPPAGSRDDPSAVGASTSAVPPPATSISGSTVPSGTGYSPPGSVVYPAVTTIPPTPRPTTTTTQAGSSGDTVTVTQDDNGKTFTLRPGEHLVVSLTDASWTWSEPDTDNATVLERTAVSANPSATHVTASFAAKIAGQAHVSASKDAPCRQSQPPCMVPTYLWQITVNVA